MRVVFLDIDGVMNSTLLWERWHKRRWFRPSFYYLNIKGFFRRIFTGSKYVAISLDKIVDMPHPTYTEKLKRFKRQTDPIAWMFLKSLILETNCKIVISSVWRNYFTLNEWNDAFEYFIQKRPVIGTTGARESCRGAEIKTWLSQHPDSPIQYAIIDDDSDMLENQMPHFFQTDGYCGLSPNIVYRIKRHFEKNI